jgi:replicative DNA helicase
MLIDFEKTVSTLRDVKSGKIKEGLKLGIDQIDEYLRFKPTNFNVILGHANVGKTSVILYLMLMYTIKHGLKWVVYSSENEAHSILRKMVEYMEQKPINKISEEAFNARLKFIYDHFKIIDNEKMYTYVELLELCTAIKNAWHYDGLLIDPYNSLSKDQKILKGLGGHEYDYQATTEMRIFCKKHRVSIWLNTHANTTALRMVHRIDHQYGGHPIPPMASDVEGGGKFVNRADDFIVIHRYTQHPTDFMITNIHVRKVKEIETGGRPTPMEMPIKMRSIINNVGFSIDGINLIQKSDDIV